MIYYVSLFMLYHLSGFSHVPGTSAIHSFTFSLTPRILCWVSYSCRLVVSNFFNRNTDIFEYFKQSFSIMSECNCSVMWISSLDQYMTIETSHFRNRKYTDRTERFVATGRTSPCAIYPRSLLSAVLCRR